MAKQNSKGNFLMQGAILGVSSILVRLIGIIYRVPLNNILGEKGVAELSAKCDRTSRSFPGFDHSVRPWRNAWLFPRAGNDDPNCYF